MRPVTVLPEGQPQCISMVRLLLSAYVCTGRVVCAAIPREDSWVRGCIDEAVGADKSRV